MFKPLHALAKETEQNNCITMVRKLALYPVSVLRRQRLETLQRKGESKIVTAASPSAMGSYLEQTKFKD